MSNVSAPSPLVNSADSLSQAEFHSHADPNGNPGKFTGFAESNISEQPNLIAEPDVDSNGNAGPERDRSSSTKHDELADAIRSASLGDWPETIAVDDELFEVRRVCPEFAEMLSECGYFYSVAIVKCRKKWKLGTEPKRFKILQIVQTRLRYETAEDLVVRLNENIVRSKTRRRWAVVVAIGNLSRSKEATTGDEPECTMEDDSELQSVCSSQSDVDYEGEADDDGNDYETDIAEEADEHEIEPNAETNGISVWMVHFFENGLYAGAHPESMNENMAKAYAENYSRLGNYAKVKYRSAVATRHVISGSVPSIQK